MTVLLPRAGAPIIQDDGKPTTEHYQWCARMTEAVNEAATPAVVEEAAPADPSLPLNTLALGLRSVQHFGSLADGQVAFALRGDVVAPGLNYVYGTDAAGVRGWQQVITQTITDGDTTHAPSGDAVFDALALKYDKAGGLIDGDVKVGVTANSFSGTGRSVSVSAGQSGDNSGGMNIEGSRTGSGQLFARFGFWHQGTLVASFNGVRGAADEGSFAIATKVTGGGLNFRWEVAPTGHFLPWADNTYDHGSSTRRAANAYAKNLRPGAGAVLWTSGTGTPEGVVVAPVGSLYTRTDGGAGTTLYIKESGASSTGWAAK